MEIGKRYWFICVINDVPIIYYGVYDGKLPVVDTRTDRDVGDGECKYMFSVDGNGGEKKISCPLRGLIFEDVAEAREYMDDMEYYYDYSALGGLL